MARFAVDESFPESLLASLDLGVPEAELVPLRRIHPGLTGLDDWELLLALYHLGEWDGLITTDGAMVKLPRELAVVHQTGLSLVVVDESGHDPIRALGLLLLHLPAICRKTVRTAGQIWVLRFAAKNHDEPWEILRTVAKHKNVAVQALFQEHRLSKADLARNPLTQPRIPS